MRVSINWLNSYLKRPLSTDEIVEALERTEVEIEEIISPPLLDKKIITAKVVKVLAHPNADKLQIVDIEYAGTKRRVVCGAPNVRAGLVVAYTAPGSKLPDGMEITEREIRGEKSAGMLASASELGLSEDHSGIIELDPDLPLGISLCDIENLANNLDVKTPANRWDLLSVIGLAREISANSSNNQVIEPKRAKIEYKNREVVKVKEDGECQRFVSAVVKINNDVETPRWIVDNLESAGMRSISPIVDISNFVMLETGQPSHAYDSAKVNGAMQVRFAKAGEVLPTLDGVVRKLTREDLIIADSRGPIGLAGVMGGQKTETETNTKEIILEVASFDKTTIRRSALRHGLRSEASTRFEKGLPLPLPRFAFERLMQLLGEVCNAEIISDANDQLYGWPWIYHVGLRQRKAEAVLGMKLDEKQLIGGLRERGFEAEHFSLAKEARKHLGKPYLWGASYKKNGTDAFDCGYFIDYIYSLIGQMVGHQCLELFESGKSVEVDDLKPGDVVFRNGPWIKLKEDDRKGLSHAALYVGGGKIIHAADTARGKNGEWEKLPTKEQTVREDSVDIITKDPDYRGARRYIDNFNHIIAVTAPWWRTDVSSESDLIEEAAKIVGYENMPSDLPKLPPMNTADHQMLTSLMKLREDLVAAGLFEVMTYSFVSEQDLLDTNILPDEVLAIENPMSQEQAYLRNSLLSSHLQTAARNNSYYKSDYGYFELSRVYEKDIKLPTLSTEQWHLGVTAVGQNSVAMVKSVLDMLDDRYGLALDYQRSEEDMYLSGRVAKVGSQRVPGLSGVYGQLKPALLKKFAIEHEVSYAEVSLPDQSVFDEVINKSHALLPYQLISRDLTLEVRDEVLWQTVRDSLSISTNLIRVEFLQEFADDELLTKKVRRLSMRLWLDCGAQPAQEEINSALQAIVKNLLSTKGLEEARIV